MKKRLYRYDNIKALLILLVVVAHLEGPFAEGKPAYDTFKSLCVFISSFHMPLFIMISGMFYKRDNVVKRVLYYLMVGLSLKIVMFLISLLINGGTWFSLSITDGIPWFMFVLAAYTALVYFLEGIDWKVCLVFAFLLGCFAGYDREIGDFLCLSRMIVYFPFFYSGMLLSGRKQDPVPSGMVWKLLSAALIVVWGLLCWKCLDPVYRLRGFFTGRNPFPDNELFYWGGLIRLLCYVITYLLCFAFIILIPEKKLPFVSACGARTVRIYFWSQPAINILFSKNGLLYADLLPVLKTPPGKFLFICSGLVLVAVLSLKIFDYPMCVIRKRLDF